MKTYQYNLVLVDPLTGFGFALLNEMAESGWRLHSVTLCNFQLAYTLEKEVQK